MVRWTFRLFYEEIKLKLKHKIRKAVDTELCLGDNLMVLCSIIIKRDLNTISMHRGDGLFLDRRTISRKISRIMEEDRKLKD